MRGLVVLALLVALLGFVWCQRFNEADLNNEVLVKKGINCLLDRGPCDRNGKLLKAAAPEVIGRNCQKCNPRQKAQAQRLLAWGMQRYPNEYAQIRAKYSGRATG